MFQLKVASQNGIQLVIEELTKKATSVYVGITFIKVNKLLRSLNRVIIVELGSRL